MKRENLLKVAQNALIFLAPVLLIYLGFVLVEIKKDGFQLVDFVPTAESLTTMVLWTVNVAIDFLRKLKK